MSSNNNSHETSSALLRLSGRKHKAKMGADLNESVACGVGKGSFARRQLEKLGWTEGTGLGKNRDGRSDHIRVTKRAEGQAIGAASTEIDPVVTGEQWWKSSVGNTLARLAEEKAKKKEKKRNKKDKDKEKSGKKKKKSSKKRKIDYTDEELFEATGGVRFGMRAQTQQRGKWNRAEEGITKEEEETAMRNTEWDGMAAPKVVLSSASEAELKRMSKSKSSKSKSSQQSLSREPNSNAETATTERKKKRQKISLEDVKDVRESESESSGAEQNETQNQERDDDDDDDDDLHNKKEKPKKEKKVKKEKKKKRRKDS